MDEAIGPDERHPARYWHRLDDGRLQCDLCPRDCRLHDGQRGACFVRGRVGDGMVLTTYGRASGFCVDPIEKKPLHHFLPGSRILSFGTAGCNLACRFCQNWDLSKSRHMDRLQARATPFAIAKEARARGCPGVAFTYNDPVIFLEYALDTADACHELKQQAVAVTAGYLHDAPRRDFFARMDAANIDLKGFTEDFYVRLCGGHLQPVLDTLAYVRHETACWLEITTLLIPGHNDGDAELKALSGWVARELGSEAPLHFTAFHPDWKMRDVPPTPLATLQRARRIARDAGLCYVYTGNVRDLAGGTTECPGCGHAVIVRDGYTIRHYDLTGAGGCPACGRRIAGHFGSGRVAGGRQRVPRYVPLGE